MQTFYANFITHKVALGLDEAQLTELEAAAADAEAQLLAAEAARAAGQSAVSLKDATLSNSRQVVAKYARLFDANLEIPNALLTELMLPPHDPPRSLTPPAQPIDPFANSDGLGNIVLRWKKNGNITGTTFVIAYRSSPSAAFTHLGTTTKSKFEKSWTPGQYVEYRVFATREGVSSIASNSVVLWSCSTDQILKLVPA